MKLVESDALLIVDVQRDFLPGGALAVPRGDEVVPTLARLAGHFAAASRPVVASRDWHPPDHCSFKAQGGPWPPHCVAGTPGAELDDALSLPRATRIVDKAVTAGKDAYSAFDDTGLADWLRDNDIDRVFVGGLATEYCVFNTAADAIRSGFDVVLLEDAVRAIDDEAGRQAVETLLEMNATVLNSGEVHDG